MKLSFYPVGDTEEETSGRGVTEAAHSVASHSPGEIQKPEEQKLCAPRLVRTTADPIPGHGSHGKGYCYPTTGLLNRSRKRLPLEAQALGCTMLFILAARVLKVNHI